MSTPVRGHGPHYTWLFFFGDSNRPTLFIICYAGSIEKLTLLGAIYYYYYYDQPRSMIYQVRVHVVTTSAVTTNPKTPELEKEQQMTSIEEGSLII
jgi:hypothetical protein